MSQNSINHHYVPQGLLKKWYIKNSSEKNKGFWKYQRNRSGEVILIPTPSSTKSSCSKKDLNTTYQNVFSVTQEVIVDSNSIENELAKLDSDALDEINKILASKNNISEEKSNFLVEELTRDKLNTEAKVLLAKFILSLHFRHPETLELVKKIVEDKGESYYTFLTQILKEYNIQDHLKFLSKNMNLHSMMRILNAPENYSHLVKMSWMIVVFNNDFLFSGEKPLVINFSKNETKPNEGFALSLSPTVLLIGIDPKFFENNFKGFQDFINAFVVSYNLIVCEQSRYAISSYELDEELKDIYLSALK